jgi:hypothetical protein
MAKIHTHYDNLKVARLAPQEVIRAAYKALSQKYHPDKNPGDEKAARIMAILNSAYGTLSDPVRRREHDEWIAAEEWEIEWLESTRAEDGQKRTEVVHAWEPKEPPPSHRYRVARDPKWWFALVAVFTVGIALGALVLGQPRPIALAPVTNARAEARLAESSPLAEARKEAADSWAVAGAARPDTVVPEVRTLAVTQLVVPARAPDCDAELHLLAAPNGEPWPNQSGYVDGYPVGNRGDEMQLLVDNSANSSPVFVKVFDLDRRSNVRHVFVLANDSLSIDKLAAGKYELRYQNVQVGGSKDECVRRRRSLKQAAAGTPET